MVEKFEVRVPSSGVLTKECSLSPEVRTWLHQNCGSNISDKEHVPWDYLRDEHGDDHETYTVISFMDKKKAALFRLFYG
jgi:hypothetical protein